MSDDPRFPARPPADDPASPPSSPAYPRPPLFDLQLDGWENPQSAAPSTAEEATLSSEDRVGSHPVRRQNRRLSMEESVQSESFSPEDFGTWEASEPVAVTEQGASQVPTSPVSPPPRQRVRTSTPRPRRRIKPGWLVLSTLLLAGLLYLSWSQLPIKTVQVSGNAHLASGEVRRLAGLPEGRSPFGWLYYGAWKAQGLLTSPWIATAEVTRKFPDTVQIAVTERQPFARWQRSGEPEVLVAEDGTVLSRTPGVQPGDTASLPVVSGWGANRLGDALRLTRALSRYTVQSVTYTPAGFMAKTAGGTVWGGDLETLVKYAGSIGMYPNKQIHIYPWGVSVQE